MSGQGNWHNKYEERRTSLLKTLGQLEGVVLNDKSNDTVTQLGPSFMVRAFQLILALTNDSERIEGKLNKIEAETTKIIELFTKWTDKYQPILDKVAEEYGMLDKVKKN